MAISNLKDIITNYPQISSEEDMINLSQYQKWAFYTGFYYKKTFNSNRIMRLKFTTAGSYPKSTYRSILFDLEDANETSDINRITLHFVLDEISNEKDYKKKLEKVINLDSNVFIVAAIEPSLYIFDSFTQLKENVSQISDLQFECKNLLNINFYKKTLILSFLSDQDSLIVNDKDNILDCLEDIDEELLNDIFKYHRQYANYSGYVQHKLDASLEQEKKILRENLKTKLTEGRFNEIENLINESSHNGG